MQLYGRNLHGLVIMVDDRINSYSGIKKGKSIELLFPLINIKHTPFLQPWYNNEFIRKKIGLLGSIVLMQLKESKDTSRKCIFNTKLSTQQFRAIIKVKILQEIME